MSTGNGSNSISTDNSTISIFLIRDLFFLYNFAELLFTF
jgi:hypothetical protein